MSVGKNKKILLGITGSIAAYKCATLIRLLVKAGHEVKCIMTESATKFIAPLTLSTLSKNKVVTDFFKEEEWENHVALGMWADVMLIAPLSATTLSKLANGLSDNMLVATYLSAKCPCIVAPAMDLDMWVHQSTVRNLEIIKRDGVSIIPVGEGELASGLHGPGRMAEVEEIVEFLDDFFEETKDLRGKKILITAGPTFEHLDPVRFIGNHSSGKMGIALANEAARRGGEVYLVLGPTKLTPTSDVKVINVVSANEMYEACNVVFETCDIVIWSAAVADYKPINVSKEKIKKSDTSYELKLEKTIDIAGTLGNKKAENQVLVGFALETNDEYENAIKKIHKKNLDFIVLNSLNDQGAGFGHDTNRVTIITENGKTKVFELKTKIEVAKDIINEIIALK